MELGHFFLAGLLFVCACATQYDIEEDYCDVRGECTDDRIVDLLFTIWDPIDDGSIGKDEVENTVRPARRRRAANYDYGFDSLSSRLPHLSGPAYKGRAHTLRSEPYKTVVKQQQPEVERRSFHYSVPSPTYHKSFREGKWHLDNKHVVKNYYKKGTYEVAKKYFIALPYVKIVPVRTTTSIDYVGELQTYSGYQVRLCQDCYNGRPQIILQSLRQPYRNVIRRFNFLPETKRTRTEYGDPRIVQTGHAHISDGHGYQGQYHST